MAESGIETTTDQCMLMWFSPTRQNPVSTCPRSARVPLPLADPAEVRARMALLSKDVRAAERIYLEQGQTTEAIETYQVPP